MEWTSEQRIEGGLLERGFRVGLKGDVPGLLWTAGSGASGAPLVLIGHGGSGSKRAPNVLAVRDLYAARGVATAAIDGPVHGDRGPVTDVSQPEYSAMWHRNDTVDGMSRDWRATLDALLATGEFDAGAVGYHGVSMGTMFGIPFVGTEVRIRAAVLGLCGFTGPSIERSGLGSRLQADTTTVRCPVLFHFQWDDERFDRDGSLAMFDALGTSDKRLQATPGLHVDTTPEALATMVEFLAGRLAVRVPA